jgi:hypothetical protein
MAGVSTIACSFASHVTNNTVARTRWTVAEMKCTLSPYRLKVPDEKAPKKVWRTFISQTTATRRKEAEEAQLRERQKAAAKLKSYRDVAGAIYSLKEMMTNLDFYVKHGGTSAEALEQARDLSMAGFKMSDANTLIEAGQLLKQRLLLTQTKVALCT